MIVSRESLNLHASAGFRFHRRPHRDERFVQRAFRRLIVELAHLDLGAARAAACACAEPPAAQ